MCVSDQLPQATTYPKHQIISSEKLEPLINNHLL